MEHSEQEVHLQQPLEWLKVVDLKAIIRKMNALPQVPRMLVTGNKPVLAQRIKVSVVHLIQVNRPDLVERVIRILNEQSMGRSKWLFHNGKVYNEFCLSKEQRQQIVAEQALAGGVAGGLAASVRFKTDPFYELLEYVVPPKLLPASGYHRNSIVSNFYFSPHQVLLLQQPPAPEDGRPSYEVRLCCAEYKPPGNGQDDGLLLEFPEVCEVRINRDTIPGQRLRGRKNRPGTISPQDITRMCRIGEGNSMEFLYVNTTKVYVFCVVLIRRKSIPSLVQKLTTERFIPKEEVLMKFQERVQDADVVMSSETVSMKCPLGFTRIQVPCRSSLCQHVQCFDAATFLTMNEQTPTWSCPVCDRKVQSIDELAVDGYFADLLANIPDYVEKACITPDGQLQIIKEEAEEETGDGPYPQYEPSTNKKQQQQSVQSIMILDDDEDEHTAQEGSSNVSGVNEPNVNTRAVTTSGDAETSSQQQPLPSSSSRKRPSDDDSLVPPAKRNQRVVIDLTMSSDEEGEESQSTLLRAAPSTSVAAITPATTATTTPITIVTQHVIPPFNPQSPTWSSTHSPPAAGPQPSSDAPMATTSSDRHHTANSTPSLARSAELTSSESSELSDLSEPAASEPTVSELAISEPAISEPPISEPATSESTTSESWSNASSFSEYREDDDDG